MLRGSLDVSCERGRPWVSAPEKRGWVRDGAGEASSRIRKVLGCIGTSFAMSWSFKKRLTLLITQNKAIIKKTISPCVVMDARKLIILS